MTMQKTLLSLAAAFGLSLGAQAANDLGLIDNQYIVTLQNTAQTTPLNSTVDALLAGFPGVELLHQYDTVLQGFSARMSAEQAALLELNPLVARIEQDRMSIATAIQNGATWGIDRVDQLDLPLDGQYHYASGAGAGAHVYVIDTGINPDHVEFSGRLGTSRNFVATGLFFSADPDDWDDCNGHGTHVSSTAVGTTWGVAKQATIHAVRVLDCLGSGSGSDIIAGMEWVADNAEFPAVVNMSLGTVNGRSQAQEDAAAALFNTGVLPVVAAGNDSTDACTTSPSAEPLALTIASSDNADRQSSFSNHGSCVDLFAPGSDITAANYNNNTGSQTMSGTSMASPHAAGVAAVLLAQNPALSPADLSQQIVATASPNTLTQVSANTPNLMLYVDASGDVPPPVDQPPVAAFSVDCNELNCSFDASASSDDHGITSYSWSFGDGNSSTGGSASHTYVADGEYTVNLTVTDTAAQTHGSSQTFSVEAGNAGGGNDGEYQGTLNGSGDAHYYSSEAGFEHAGGLLEGDLVGPVGTDFDLRLQRYSCGLFGCSWSDSSSSTSTSSVESISYNGSAGTYRWKVESYSGAGAYTLTTTP